jgi:hypothetical protein
MKFSKLLIWCFKNTIFIPPHKVVKIIHHAIGYMTYRFMSLHLLIIKAPFVSFHFEELESYY